MRLATTVLLVLALACRAERPEQRAAVVAAPGDSAVTVAGQDSLALTLVVPASVRPGEPVPLQLRLENRASRPLDLYLRGRSITFDVEVARADGTVVWRRLEGEIIPAILQLRTLAPGERLELEAEWDQRSKAGKPVEPGEYVARGFLLVEGEPLATPPASLRIAGRGG